MTWEPAMIMVDMSALSPSGAHLANMEVMQGKVPASQQPIRNLITSQIRHHRDTSKAWFMCPCVALDSILQSFLSADTLIMEQDSGWLGIRA